MQAQSALTVDGIPLLDYCSPAANKDRVINPGSPYTDFSLQHLSGLRADWSQ